MSEPIKLLSLNRNDDNYIPIQREGIELDKGVVLTNDYLEAHEELFK